ncbi:MAG: VWA domain-containing protein [Clostridiales bacterium]|nr:VWA domain-containing protein [Clostridiales bacterium]
MKERVKVRILAIVLAVIMCVPNMNITYSYAEETEEMVEIIFVDETEESWVSNDNACMELVDNTNGHDKYDMEKIDEETWSVEIPIEANNITFNRYNSDKTIKWNSWSAGGREGKSVYLAQGSEYGIWSDEVMVEEGFKEGDVVYLDVSHFKDWENEDAQIYINFTNASKTENGGKDITISTADKNLYQPKIVNIKADTNVYAYKVAEEDEGKTVLRFWRGDKEKLWNCSIPLSYSEFVEGNDSIRILGWNDTGEKYQGEYPIDEDQDGVEYAIEKLFGTSDVKSDTDGDGLTDYIEIYQSETDPCIKDTDENGVEDGDEDSDEDGLTNLEEVQYGTDLGKSDTDGDGLKDGEEKNKYYTNPVKYDTDDDGISDGNEVLLGLNPLKIKSDGVTLDAERTFEQKLDEGCIEEELLEEENLVKPYISGNVPDVIDEHVTIGLEELDILEDNRAVIGNQINLETDYAQDTKLELHFECNSDRKDYFMICRYENDEIIPCETNIEEDDIWTIAESGCYFVMDAEQLLMDLDIPITDYKEETKKTTFNTILKNSSTEKSTNNQVGEDWYEKNYTLVDEDGNKIEESSKSISNYSTKNEGIHYILSSAAEQTCKETANINNKISGQADVVFVIDSTGSMSGTINNVVSNIDEFVDALTSNYAVKANFALIDYKDITCANEETVLVKNGTSNWFTDATEFKNCINSIYVSGGGDVPETALDGLAMASQLDFRKNANKFIVLVTDADYKNENNYEISSMEEMVSILSDSNIVTSVITSDTYESTYHNLYTDTNGVFGNINGNFSEELLKLAEKIGDVVNDGSWVLLNDFQYVKINSIDITDGTDTDGDGLTDAEELGEEVETDLTPYIKGVLKRYNKPYACYQGKTFVKTYKYKSSPVELDTDYDGIPDRKDDNPKSNKFEGKMHVDVGRKNKLNMSLEKTCNVEFSVNYRNMFDNNKKYKKQLAVLSSLFAADIYEDAYIKVTKGAEGGSPKSQIDFAELFGLKDVEDIEVKGGKYDSDDVTEFVVGHRNVYYNNEHREIFILVVRGTNGTNAEWSSNFDVGADDDAYYGKVGTNHPDWKNKINHKGFDVTANRVLKEYNDYIKRHQLDKSKCKKSILITGHSRGAAIANLLGAHFEEDKEYKSYTYTFASPGTTTDSDASNKKYNSVKNIVNKDDLIPCLPLEKWGFARYGVTKSISVEKEYEHKGPRIFVKKGTWEWLMKRDYNNDGGVSRTIGKFEKIANNRKQLYIYDSSKEGKVNVDNTLYPGKATVKKGKNGLINRLKKAKLEHFCKFNILKSQGRYYIETTYCPAYLMQNLANMASGVGPTTGYRTNGKYDEAKKSFILSSGKVWENCPVGGMTHPHMQPTYYLIAYNNFKKLK